MSLEVMSSFKTSVDAMVKVLIWNVDSLENWHHNFIQKKYGRKRCLLCTHFVIWTAIFLFVQTFYITDDFLR